MHVAMEVSEVLSTTSSGMGTVHGMVVGHVSLIKASSKQKDIKYFDSQCGLCIHVDHKEVNKDIIGRIREISISSI